MYDPYMLSLIDKKISLFIKEPERINYEVPTLIDLQEMLFSKGLRWTDGSDYFMEEHFNLVIRLDVYKAKMTLIPVDTRLTPINADGRYQSGMFKGVKEYDIVNKSLVKLKLLPLNEPNLDNLVVIGGAVYEKLYFKQEETK